MKFIMTLFCLMLCLLPQFAFALFGQVEVMQVSSTGKTIILNVGPDANIVSDDYGILISKDKNVLRPIAKIKSIKLFQYTSIWIVFENFTESKIRKNTKFLLVSQNELLTGRSKLKIKRSKFIGSKNFKDELKETLLEEGQSLAKKQNDYKVVNNIHDTEVRKDEDINLLDLEKWEDLSATGKKSTVAIYKSPHAKKFSERKRLDTFEKVVYATLKKYNDPKYSRSELYQEQKRANGTMEVQDNTLGGSYYDKYTKEVANKKAKEEKLYADLSSKGESWSDDYSDAELSELLNNVSIIREKERREEIMAYRYNYQLYASFGFNLLDNQILSDVENGQDKRYEFEAAIEAYPFKKVQEFNRISLELSLRRSQDGLSVGQSNAVLIDYSAGFHANWYPFHAPNTIQKNIIYFGTLFRTGIASLLDKSSGDVASYQLSSFPGLRLGIKYNFASLLGVRLSATYENIQLDRIEKSNAGSVLPDRESYLDGKLAIGLSKLF